MSDPNSNPTIPKKQRSQSAPHRNEPSHNDDRPFAEIRRNLYDVLRLLTLHRWMFFVPFCIVSCAAFIVSFYYPRTYSATTSFEVRNDPIIISLPMSPGAASYKYFRSTMTLDLTSVDAMREVVEALGLLKDTDRDESGALTPEGSRRLDRLARSLGANLAINSTSPSELVDIVRITYTGADAKIGKSLVDQVKKTYIKRTTSWIREYLTLQRDYFLREAEEAGEVLLRAQRDETRLRLESPGVDPSDPSSIAVKLSQLELEHRDLLSRRRDCDTEMIAQRQVLADAAGVLPSRLPAEVRNSMNRTAVTPRGLHMLTAIQDVVAAMTKLRETRGVTDAHPEMQELLAKKQRLEAELEKLQLPDSETDSTADSSAASTESGLLVGTTGSEQNRVNIQIAALERKIKDIDLSLETNVRAITDLTKAKEQVFDKREEFSEVLGRVAKAKQHVSQLESTLGMIEPALKAVEQDRLVQFIEGQPARGPATPISPKASTVVLLSLLMGVVAGAVFVILGELFDNIYRSSGQVAKSLGLPILEAIDEIVTPHDRRRLLVYRAVASPLIVAACLSLTIMAGSLAYLSLTQPWAYQRMRSIPQAALEIFIERHDRSADREDDVEVSNTP
ncbi:MAG: hypothetical protein HY287_04630 [Planctomycetes bacterium]|nr:hypothetical protein [Planctomycetota bacterium]